MGDPWTKCPRPPGPAEEGAPNPKGKSDGRGTKRHLVLGRQGRRALGPSLAQHWSACSHDQTQGGSHQLKLDHGWAGGWPQVKPDNSPRVAVQPPLALPTSWTATLEWEEGEKETSGLEHELNPSQK